MPFPGLGRRRSTFCQRRPKVDLKKTGGAHDQGTLPTSSRSLRRLKMISGGRPYT